MSDKFWTIFLGLVGAAIGIFGLFLLHIPVLYRAILFVIGVFIAFIAAVRLTRCPRSPNRHLSEMRRKFRDALTSINATGGDARVIDLLSVPEPDILVPFDPDAPIDDVMLLDRFQVDARSGLRAIDSARKRLPPDRNRTHAVMLESFTTNMPSVKGFVADYAFVLGHEQVTGRKPRRLSTSGLLVHRDTQHLLLHRRALGEWGGRYPGKLHIIGGNFEPARETRAFETLVREAREESRDHIHLGAELHQDVCMLAEEMDTGFQAVTFLGVEPPDHEVREIIRLGGAPATSEGRVIPVSISELGRHLAIVDDWVPSGRQAVLAWLAIGAPANGSPMLSQDQIERILTSAGISLGKESGYRA